MLETATMLGHIEETRACISNITGFELPDGGFEMIPSYHKENGLMVFMLSRHAELTQDKAWLEEQWPVIQGCIRRIGLLRDSVKKVGNEGVEMLLPRGFVDEGIRLGHEYSTPQWCLSG
jgi:hypothetical protein